MNGTSDLDTTALSEAARSRMVHIYLGTQAPGYWDSWAEWAEGAGVLPEVQGFCRFRPDLFAAYEGYEELAVYNPRTAGWIVNSLLLAARQMGAPKAIVGVLLQGAIGSGRAAELLAYLELWEQMPDIDQLLRQPGAAALPANRGIACAVAVALARRTKGEPAKARAAIQFLVRLPREVAQFGLSAVLKAAPAAAGCKEYIDWVNNRE
jgi:hypothetical protein